MLRDWLKRLCLCALAAMMGAVMAAVMVVPAQSQTALQPTTESDAPETLIDVDLQLVLAVDVSASIDAEEARLQREGYVNALLDPLVIQAIQRGAHGRIALAYIEWSGPLDQRTLVNWRIIDSPATAREFATLLNQAPVHGGRRTSISSAIMHAVPLFRKGGFRAVRKVIDISGDGPNNGGFQVHRTRHNAFDQGITINGLPIHNDRPSPLGIPAVPNIDLYYEDCVIGGPGAFIVVAETLRSFAAAVRRKLILEISGLQPPPSLQAQRRDVGRDVDGIIPAQLSLGLTDCTIGEKQYELFRQRQNLKN
ncbi:MAG: DUF1194 domain-containing protein [Proteobacteria bacterium]|nr:DUF1194 domain-containing protein [Pseudomonadota bacterium]